MLMLGVKFVVNVSLIEKREVVVRNLLQRTQTFLQGHDNQVMNALLDTDVGFRLRRLLPLGAM